MKRQTRGSRLVRSRVCCWEQAPEGFGGHLRGSHGGGRVPLEIACGAEDRHGGANWGWRASLGPAASVDPSGSSHSHTGN